MTNDKEIIMDVDVLMDVDGWKLSKKDGLYFVSQGQKIESVSNARLIAERLFWINVMGQYDDHPGDVLDVMHEGWWYVSDSGNGWQYCYALRFGDDRGEWNDPRGDCESSEYIAEPAVAIEKCREEVEKYFAGDDEALRKRHKDDYCYPEYSEFSIKPARLLRGLQTEEGQNGFYVIFKNYILGDKHDTASEAEKAILLYGELLEAERNGAPEFGDEWESVDWFEPPTHP